MFRTQILELTLAGYTTFGGQESNGRYETKQQLPVRIVLFGAYRFCCNHRCLNYRDSLAS